MKTILNTLAAVFTVVLCHKAQAKTDNAPGISAQPDSYFYTGKPYDKDLGAYTFAYRYYDPELNRWTSTDPSGFPNGANNTVYAAVPTTQLDPNGLLIDPTRPQGTLYTKFPYDWEAWNDGEFAFTTYGFNLARSAMMHADGSTPGDWYLSSSEITTLRATNAYSTDYTNHIDDLLYLSFAGSPEGTSSWSTGPDSIGFSHGSDAYYGFGHADFYTGGSVSISLANGLYTATFTANVTLYDYFDFSEYDWVNPLLPTGVGYSLQDHGWIDAFNSHGYWLDTFSTSWE